MPLRVMLDPGHAPLFPGAVSPHTKQRERDLALMLAAGIGQYLAFHHREMDLNNTIYGLYDLIKAWSGPKKIDSEALNLMRCQLAKEWGADLFISLHFNAAENQAARGSEVWVRGEQDVWLGRMFQGCLPCPHRGVKIDPELVVLKHTTCPAVLIEPLFLSNPIDAAYLETNGVGDIAYQIGVTIRLVVDKMARQKPEVHA